MCVYVCVSWDLELQFFILLVYVTGRAILVFSTKTSRSHLPKQTRILLLPPKSGKEKQRKRQKKRERQREKEKDRERDREGGRDREGERDRERARERQREGGCRVKITL